MVQFSDLKGTATKAEARADGQAHPRRLERTILAPPARVHAVLADYAGRSRILPGGFLDYKVEEGGTGGGTVVSYRLRAARRERRYQLEVSEPTPGVTLVERDRNSSLVTTWILNPAGSGTATNLKLSTIWEGRGGVAGLFERAFAPRGLRRVHGQLLDRLARQVGAEPAG